MGNKNDGNKNENSRKRYSTNPPEFVDMKSINSIEEMEEKGSFSKKEQEQFAALMKTIKKHGGFGSLNQSALQELNHIVKVLGSNEDKSIMIKDEVNDFISNIAKKVRQP